MMKIEPTALTASLKKMIDRDVENAGDNLPRLEKVLTHYEKGIEFYKNQFKKIPKPIDRAHAVHMHLERSFKEMRAKNPGVENEISCKAGCTYCCHNPVVMNEEEAHLLLAWVDHIKFEIDWDRVAKQAAFEGDDHAYFLQPKSESRCVFLGEDNLCKVYEHRPASCRKYFVRSKPEDCDDRVGLQKVEVLADTQAELATSGFMDIDHSKVGLLPKMLLQAKEKKNGN